MPKMGISNVYLLQTTLNRNYGSRLSSLGIDIVAVQKSNGPDFADSKTRALLKHMPECESAAITVAETQLLLQDLAHCGI